jgi:hypothetical protein
MPEERCVEMKSLRAQKRFFCHPHNVDDGKEMRDLSNAEFGGASRHIYLERSSMVKFSLLRSG